MIKILFLSLGVVRVGVDRFRNAGISTKSSSRSFRSSEAASSLEVGDRVDVRQARQRQAVEVAAAARHPWTSEAQSFRLARRTVKLSGIALSSETDGKII